MNKKLQNIFRNAILILFPQRCPACEKVINKNEVFCSRCMNEYKGTIYSKYAKGGFPCISAVAYDGVFSKAILKFKFNNRRQYARQLAILIEKAIREKYTDIPFDLITFVPLHPTKQEERGYNQSELLAKELSELLEIPIVDTLKKTRNNQPQHELKASKRRENVAGAYRAKDKFLVENKTILIIDDIITTGNTLGECAGTLETSGAKAIYCATFAITVVKTT